MEIDKDIEKYIEQLIKTVISQEEVIDAQDKLIETLKKSIESAEKSRQYWIDKYYELSEEVMRNEL